MEISLISENGMMEILHYLTPQGGDVFQEWLDSLKDMKGRIAMQRRVDRLADGNFGDHKFCRDGVWELRVDLGPGYRVYYAMQGKTIVLLLCGGTKRRQTTDVNAAVNYWQDFQRRIS